jgi:hypothetical protein
VETDPRWHRGQTLAAGQVAEFKVWSELVRQSMGGLHVFLPVRDMGIDGVVHRLADGVYVPVQVKARTELTPTGQVHITVTATSLQDDDAFVVAVLVEGDRLGEAVLVVRESEFRELAAHDVVEGREYLTAAFEPRLGGRSRWTPYLVSRERLAEPFGCAAGSLASLDDGLLLDRGREGFLGEAEVIRRLAEPESLNLFRPFPDLETVELVARHIGSHRCLGLQVKTAGWDPAHVEGRVYLRRSSFRPHASTQVCVVAWNRAESCFDDVCLLIPSMDIAELTRVEGEWLVLEIQPGSAHHRRMDRYRTPLIGLGRAVETLLRAES